MGVSLGILSDEGPGEASAEVLLRHPKVHWEGWGCSLAWCGKALGSSAKAEAWADLLFTLGDFDLRRLWGDQPPGEVPPRLPGLGLTVVRYNIGGTGGADQAEECRSERSRGWYAEIEGFQPGPGSAFDWERDGEQRRFLSMAVDRGADVVELFSNAPMWWMTDCKSSFGGKLLCPEEFASYLAEVAEHARSSWHLPVRSLSPLNEPSAGWWKFPHDQEGCNLPAQEQEHLLVRLRGELDRRGLDDVLIAASDENTPAAALKTWSTLREGAARGCVGRLNVHAYEGLKPWREANNPGVRSRLQRRARDDGLPVWMSEHGNGEVDGLTLAQTILEDLCHLRPTAWCYWQLVEHRCSWGLVEAEFGREDSPPVAMPHPKYYVLTHFSHYFRPGFEMLECTEPWAAAGFFEPDACLACVLVNAFAGPCRLRLGLAAFSGAGGKLTAVFTEPQRGAFLLEGTVDVEKAEDDSLILCADLPPLSICSVRVPNVRRLVRPSSGQPGSGVTGGQAREQARAAAGAAAAARVHGETDPRALSAWQRFDHLCGCADAALEAVIPSRPAREAEVGLLKGLASYSAWGAANERKYGSRDRDAKDSFDRFHALRKQHPLADDLVWMIFNTCWSVVNEAFLSRSHSHTESATERADAHFMKLGASTRVLPRRVYRTAKEVPSYPRWLAFVRHAQAGHNVDKALFETPDNPLTEEGVQQAAAAREGPAGEAVRAADLLVSSPLQRALETSRLLLGGRDAPLRVRVEPLATERYSAPCDDGTPKAELLSQLPAEVLAWEGWQELPECWWPGQEDDVGARLTDLRGALSGHSEDRVVVVGHGGFWQQLLGYYLDNCEIVFCDRSFV